MQHRELVPGRLPHLGTVPSSRFKCRQASSEGWRSQEGGPNQAPPHAPFQPDCLGLWNFPSWGHIYYFRVHCVEVFKFATDLERTAGHAWGPLEGKGSSVGALEQVRKRPWLKCRGLLLGESVEKMRWGSPSWSNPN